MLKGILNKLKESFWVVMPITALIFVVICFFVPTTSTEKLNLLLCFGLLIVGTMLFTNGANMSMIGIGESVGGGLCRTKKLWLMIISSFLIGFIITLAEPDLQVFANQVAESFPGLSGQWVIVLTVSLGVGVFLALSVIKTLFKLSLPIILTITYIIIFILSFLIPNNLIGFCYDSGSVTTGPISVPFIIAFGLGIASVRWRNKSDDDDFGMIGLCSVGPVISIMIMCLFVKNPTEIITTNTQNITYLSSMLQYMKEIALVILPILIIFIIFQTTMIKFPKKQVKKTMLGILYTYLGIVLFLIGVNVGYLPLATKIGMQLGEGNKFWVYVLGMLFGFTCVIAEPALQILKKQVKEMSHGMIKEKTIVAFIAIGVSLSVGLAILRTILNFNILWLLIPILSISLILGFINTKLFTAISFDSGGVATGAMSVSFILPFVNGIAVSLGSGSGFGTIALIASMPILTMQILGLVFKINFMKSKAQKIIKGKNSDIVDFDVEVI